ncbi:endo alpha-1,4 polygalactosaminidase [Noviherbaspirillum sp.]|uniref:endo alpha-1,4 polygalactosaminidase n=1 Tax=Noviherbaspirillum sp. TaxID=1926288 RepID=UPI0039C97104
MNQFLASDKGNALSGWAGERWLDTRSANVRQIMQKRLDLAKAKGCDGVEPDNVDGYTNNSGFPLNASTQPNYNRILAAEARGPACVRRHDPPTSGPWYCPCIWTINSAIPAIEADPALVPQFARPDCAAFCALETGIAI